MPEDSLRITVHQVWTGTDLFAADPTAVLILGGRIAEIGPDPSVPSPADVRRVELPPNVTLIPGLIDAHSHTNLPGDGSDLEPLASDSDEIMVLRTAANGAAALGTGVTTLRDNGSFHGTVLEYKKALDRGIVRGPRVLASGHPITITGGHCWHMGGEADGEDGVRRAVRQLAKDGADWIKAMASGGGTRGTHPYLPAYGPSELEALAHEAHRQGLLAAAHATNSVAIHDSVTAGFDMLVHATFADAAGNFVADQDLAAFVAGSGVWVNPTLAVGQQRLLALRARIEAGDSDPNLRAELSKHEKLQGDRERNFHMLLRAGARFVAGSDAGWGYYRFGRFNREILAMSEMGMGPEAALRAATLDSASALGLANEIGSIEVGKIADLVAVEGEPLRDLSSLEHVYAVFHAGQSIEGLVQSAAKGDIGGQAVVAGVG